MIHFTCHACGMPLTVPMELAGASGPALAVSMITSPKPEPVAQGPVTVPTVHPTQGVPSGPALAGLPGTGPSLLPLGQKAAAPPEAAPVEFRPCHPLH
ncbi:hypothetical protein [Verrucomicrobium spinosum]|uniref:hypothetical protein n=1 Tax=Verrucomicrobium spinosum TaxID=2736 RepID=UPI0012E259C7|nr:hypothetical protein [Verrucomicrobium spinosum]